MRVVRPSWVELSVDGRKAKVATGPRSRSGALSASFQAREGGRAVRALSVEFRPSADGATTTLVVWLPDGTEVLRREYQQ